MIEQIKTIIVQCRNFMVDCSSDFDKRLKQILIMRAIQTNSNLLLETGGNDLEIIEVGNKTTRLIEQLVEVWESSVKATHLFLKGKEIESIKNYVPQAIKETTHLIIAIDDYNIPIAFMGIKEVKLEMLFVTDKERGKGIGKKLLKYGIKNYNIQELVVNEQNQNAQKFYEHIGFTTYKKSELDEQGNPYPILFMKLQNKKY